MDRTHCTWPATYHSGSSCLWHCSGPGTRSAPCSRRPRMTEGAAVTDTGTEASWAKTACILCENNCGIQIQVDGRRFAKIRGDRDHVSSQGYTCNKALRLDHYQNGGRRLTSPLRREADGSFAEIDWD